MSALGDSSPASAQARPGGTAHAPVRPAQGDRSVAAIRVLVVAAHPDYEALALDELTRGGFQHESRLVTSLDDLRAALAAGSAEELWDIGLVIDTPDGPPAAGALLELGAAVGELPVIAIGRGPAIEAPPELVSLRAVELRSLAGAASDALREVERRRERRRGAQALRASEVRFSTVFDSAPIGLALVRVDGRFLAVNPVFCAIAGAGRDAVVGATEEGISADDLLSCVRAAALAVAGGGTGEAVERRAIRSDGTPRWVRVSASPAFDDAGDIAYLVAHVEDVTDRREAEEARARGEALFEAVFTANNVGISVVGRDSRYVKTNAAFERFLGYTGEELRGMAIADVSHPEDMAVNQALRDDHLDGGESFRMEKRYVRKDGSVVWAVLSVAPLGGDTGEWLSMGSIVDITERKQAEARLEESARILDTARTLAGLASWVGWMAPGTTERLMTWSPELFRMFGLEPRPTPVSMDELLMYVHPDDRARVVEQVSVAGPGTRLALDHRIVRPDGEVRWLRVRGDVFADADGSARVVGVTLDITHEREALAAADASARALQAVLRPAPQPTAVDGADPA